MGDGLADPRPISRSCAGVAVRPRRERRSSQPGQLRVVTWCGWLLLAAVLSGFTAGSPLVLQGTSHTVTVARLPANLDARRQQAQLDLRPEGVNARMSAYRADSELSRFNRSRDLDRFEVSAALLAVPHALASVTVVGPSAMRSDAIATALLVPGPEHSWRFAAAQDIAALFILRDGDGFTDRRTEAFRRTSMHRAVDT